MCVYRSSDMRRNVRERLFSSTVDEMAIKSVIGAGVVCCVVFGEDTDMWRKKQC